MPVENFEGSTRENGSRWTRSQLRLDQGLTQRCFDRQNDPIPALISHALGGHPTHGLQARQVLGNATGLGHKAFIRGLGVVGLDLDRLLERLDAEQLLERGGAGEAEGEIIGGNLSLLVHLIGSESFPNPAGKILFIEEVGERRYHVDRMLVQLKRAGYFNQLKGIIIGGFTDCDEAKLEIGKTVEELVLEHSAETTFPIAFNFPAGHIPNNFALPFGTKIKFLVNSEIVQVTGQI